MNKVRRPPPRSSIHALSWSKMSASGASVQYSNEYFASKSFCFGRTLTKRFCLFVTLKVAPTFTTSPSSSKFPGSSILLTFQTQCSETIAFSSCVNLTLFIPRACVKLFALLIVYPHASNLLSVSENLRADRENLCYFAMVGTRVLLPHRS